MCEANPFRSRLQGARREKHIVSGPILKYTNLVSCPPGPDFLAESCKHNQRTVAFDQWASLAFEDGCNPRTIRPCDKEALRCARSGTFSRDAEGFQKNNPEVHVRIRRTLDFFCRGSALNLMNLTQGFG